MFLYHQIWYIYQGFKEFIGIPFRTRAPICHTQCYNCSYPNFNVHTTFHSPSIQSIMSKIISRRNKGHLIRYIIKTSTDEQELPIDCFDQDGEIKGILFLTHGLAGNSNETYIQHWKNYCDKENLQGIIYNRRASVLPLNEKATRLPKYTDNDDLRDVFNFINLRFGNDFPIYGVGYSAGGPHLIAYEASNPGTFKGIVMVCSAIDLVSMSSYLQTKAYDIDRVLGSLMSYIYRTGCGQTFIKDKINGISNITDMDIITSKLHGYSNVHAYYLDVQPLDKLLQINTPILHISSQDDPLLCPKTFPTIIDICNKKQNIQAIITTYGGHIGCVTNDSTLYVEDIVIPQFIANLNASIL